MSPTQTQLRNVARFTFGSANHRVISYTASTRLERRGANHDVFRGWTFTIRTEIEGADLADLKTKADNLASQLIASGSNFRLERGGTVIYELLAANCHHGPVASINPDGREQHGFIETVTVTIEALVPVSVVGGLIDHFYTERTKSDEDGLAETVRSGQVTTASGTSAEAWINANLPGQPADTLRTIEINTDDSDTEATYTLTDARSDRRNSSGTVRSHTWTETTVSRFGVQQSRVRAGQVQMVPGQSALAFINANLPGTIAGFDRETQIDVRDDDETGSYRVSDLKSTRRNTSAQVHDHQFTHSTLKVDGDLTEESWNGRVEMETGESARTFIEANLPIGGASVKREVRIDTADDDLTGTYSVRDTPVEWGGVPGIENASQTNEEEKDEQGRIRLTRSGFFAGENALQEVDAVRAALATLGRIISESLTYDIYGDKRISFRFTAIDTADSTGIAFWQEAVTKRGGKKTRVASVYPDREPFFYFAETTPIVVELTGRAVALRNSSADRYVAPPLPPDQPVNYADLQSGETEFETVRLDRHHCQTTWRMTFLVPVGTPIPKPRAPIANFLP